MKYLSVNAVVKAYMDFQGSMTNKSWGFLSILKQVPSIIRPGVTYEIDCNSLSTYLEEIFCISDDRKQYVSGTAPWYVMFSNKWLEFFQNQGNTIPNIYDVIAWAYRREAFPDSITNLQLLAKFANDFHIEKDKLNKAFSTTEKPLEFVSYPYNESQLQSTFSSSGLTMVDKNLTAIKTTVKAAPGELSRGPFIQTLYAALDTSDYLIISQSNFSELYDKDREVFAKAHPAKASNLQQIFYGAPGTGKSHTIETETKGKEVIRVTFHPDSDYSTFVGAYKPTTVEVPVRDVTGKIIKENGEEVTETRIVYKYVPQAFLKAYVKAWKNLSEPVYLVIEEINRGNCAQIFGDIFQLLDRNENGYSSYEVDPDMDITAHLKKEFDKGIDANASDKVKNGEKMVLPPNLFIWATMNTSDQSLFPIDSAFKRRWDWVYMPIDTKKENWTLSVNGKPYNWTSFLDNINSEIYDLTKSEDKMLGFYFCKAEDNKITADRFVSKVLFYLYNDVFKDYGLDSREFFKDKENGSNVITFQSLYSPDGTVDQKKVETLLLNLNVDIVSFATDNNEEEISDDDDDASEAKNAAGEHKESLVSVTIDGEKLTAIGRTQFDLYLEVLQKLGINEMGAAIETLKYRRKGSPMATKVKFDTLINAQGYDYVQAGDYYFVKGSNGYTLVRILEDLKTSLNLDIEIEYK